MGERPAVRQKLPRSVWMFYLGAKPKEWQEDVYILDEIHDVV